LGRGDLKQFILGHKIGGFTTYVRKTRYFSKKNRVNGGSNYLLEFWGKGWALKGMG